MPAIEDCAPETIVSALTEVPSGCRRVIVEIYYNGCSVAEAARNLGISTEMVEQRALSALQSFRMALVRRGLG
jgi:DNA-directed RNA polymerase specialized sigma24 family protein